MVMQNPKETGSFYTPYHLADDITKRTLKAAIKDHVGITVNGIPRAETLKEDTKRKLQAYMENIRILDPAAGNGVFLVASANHLLKLRRELGEDSGDGHIAKSILKRNLFGLDISHAAVEDCARALKDWAKDRGATNIVCENVKVGNTLIGEVTRPRADKYHESPSMRLQSSKELESKLPFQWNLEFPHIFSGENPGFDVIVGNPPYGNILSQAERAAISNTRTYDVSSGGEGTWNSAGLFIPRAFELLKKDGYLGFLVPNSLLRTKHFHRVRRFLLSETKMWLIIDEGSPFKNVTLEMVSIFCRAGRDTRDHQISVTSRRPEIHWEGKVPWAALDSSGLFPIYYDSILAKITKKADKGWIKASRGRDIPRAHVRKKRTNRFSVPYATSGRSVKRYRLDSRYLVYSDMAFKQDRLLLESYNNDMLISTKNYPYPRCVMKPRGVIHGGGAVRIIPLREGVDLESLGLILNSRLVRYLCLRYLTNYSQLTTCLNTGIMEELPLLFPKNTKPYSILFRALENLHGNLDSTKADTLEFLERTSDALVYELFLLDSDSLTSAVEERLSGAEDKLNPRQLLEMLRDEAVSRICDNVLSSRIVREIEGSHRMH